MAGIILCPRCQKRNQTGVVYCQYCGATMPAAPAASYSSGSSASRGSASNGWAAASLVLGLLGLFTIGLTALAGLVLGIIGLRQSQREGQSQGLAVGGIVVSILVLGLMFVFVPITAAILFPVFAQARERARQAGCMSHMRQVAMATLLYTQDYDEHLPRKQNWCSEVRPYLRTSPGYPAIFAFQCPSLPDQPSGQAYNAQMSGIATSRIGSPAMTVLLFEGRGGWNQAGGPALADARHFHGLNAAFVDGRVWYLRSLDRVVWRPGAPAARSHSHRGRRHRRHGSGSA